MPTSFRAISQIRANEDAAFRFSANLPGIGHMNVWQSVTSMFQELQQIRENTVFPHIQASLSASSSLEVIVSPASKGKSLACTDSVSDALLKPVSDAEDDLSDYVQSGQKWTNT